MADSAYYDADLDLEAMVHTPHYASWIIESFRPYLIGNIIEIGAGIGTMSARLKSFGTRLDLLEPSSELVERLHSRFAATSTIRIFNESVEAHFASANASIYDTAIMINVLEHIDDDVAVLKKIRKALNPKGHLLIYVPAMPGLYSKLDRSIGHFRRYSKEMLAERMGAAGYRLISIGYMDMLGVIPWYIVNTLMGAAKISPKMASFYDCAGIPVTRMIERLIVPRFGKNLIAIATKV